MAVRREILAIGLLAGSATAANAYEFGFAGAQTMQGVIIGVPAANPPPGLYGFDQVFTYQAHLVGPGSHLGVNGAQPTVKADVGTHGFVWVPGWEFLGASYNATFLLHYVSSALGDPINATPSGLHNPYISNALSWRLGDSGFFVKAGLGVYIPIGTQQGPAGLDSPGTPWWTFQPSLMFSYMKDGWNLTANLYDEINTENSITKYRSGDVFHAEFTATKTIGNWTFGPVGYYVGQVTNDRSSAYWDNLLGVKNAINTNRYNVWAAGALVGYDWGPASVNVWATREFSANASGGNAGLPGLDSATVGKGFTVFAQLNYRIWAPEAPAVPKLSGFHK